jgi:RES domain-containing protein
MVQSKYSGDAFTGEGARRYGGRWNHKGVPMVYTSGSVSLAALEMLVHIEEYKLLERYVCILLEFDDSLCAKIGLSKLPSDWRSVPAPYSTKEIGSEWIRQMSSVVLIVPSVVVPVEYNFLINPFHPDFNKVSIGKPQSFHFDPRLVNS